MCFSIYKKEKEIWRCCWVTMCPSAQYVLCNTMYIVTLCPTSQKVRLLHYIMSVASKYRQFKKKYNYLHYDRCYIIPDNTSDQNVVTICLPLWITRHLLKKITFFFKCRHSFLLKNMTISHCFSHSLSVFLNMNSIRRNHYSYEETKRQFTCTVNVNLLCFLTVVKI